MPAFKGQSHNKHKTADQQGRNSGTTLQKSKERSATKKKQKLERKERRSAKKKGTFGSE